MLQNTKRRFELAGSRTLCPLGNRALDNEDPLETMDCGMSSEDEVSLFWNAIFLMPYAHTHQFGDPDYSAVGLHCVLTMIKNPKDCMFQASKIGPLLYSLILVSPGFLSGVSPYFF